MTQATLVAVDYHLPENALTNTQLVTEFPEWTVGKIEEKTGIKKRYVAADDECSSDLGVKAAEKLFERGVCRPEDIDYLLFCTQSPDYFLPTSGCVMQERLGLPRAVGALDFSLGCSGFVYGLGLAKGLIETNQASNVLLVTAETYSKFIHPGDKSVRTIFSDAGAAALVQGCDERKSCAIGPFVYGTDGRGAMNLIVPNGGMRHRLNGLPAVVEQDAHGNSRSADHLYMNGSEIFAFTLSAVPTAVKRMLAVAERSIEEIDLFVFHQANKFMLEHLRKKTKIPSEKFVLALENFGNTVSCTIPIALREASRDGRLTRGQQVMLVGFGVGYSWACTLVNWAGEDP